jgi:hypothetical protein
MRRRHRDHWQRMVVIDATGSFRNAAAAEAMLIEHARKAGYGCDLRNDASGSDKPRPQANYIYVPID